MKKHRKSIPRGHLALSQCVIQSIQMHTIESKFLANVEHNRSFAGHLRHQEHLLPFVNILPKRDHSCAGLWSVCFSTVEEDPSIVLKWRVYIAHIVTQCIIFPTIFHYVYTTWPRWKHGTIWQYERFKLLISTRCFDFLPRLANKQIREAYYLGS